MGEVSATPIISVIMPVYNCEQFLPQALDSLQGQTFAEFELLLVDDGSTDATAEIAQQHAESDSRITVLHQDHCYAGAARNLGLSQAKGEYVIFLDGDDYFLPTMLEHAWKKITQERADICVFPVISLNQETGDFLPLMHSCRMELVPPTGCFNSETNPRHIFCFTTPAPWNKLFRRQFILDMGLQFEATRSANDFCFVLMALALAPRIVTLDDYLMVYRQNVKTSLQATQRKDPLAFWDALMALKFQLNDRGLFGRLNHAFTNTALDFCVYNLSTLKNSPVEHQRVFDFLKEVGFREAGILDKPQTYFYVYPPARYRDYCRIRDLTYEEFIGAALAAPNAEADQTQLSATAQSNVSTQPTFKQKLRRALPVQAKAFDRRCDKLEKKVEANHKQGASQEATLRALQKQVKDVAYQLSVLQEQTAALLERLSAE